MKKSIDFPRVRSLAQRHGVPPLFSVLLLFSLSGPLFCAQTANSSPPNSAASPPAPNAETLVVPAGTRVHMALTRAVWAAKAKAGDPLYLQTVFPVAAGGRIAIPAGTYVAATIDALQPPTRKTDRAEVEVDFQQIIFAGGYTVALGNKAATGASTAASSGTRSLVTIQVGRGNDLLLDNGSQIDMAIEEPLSLDGSKVAWAVPRSHAPGPETFRSATLCRPTAGDPGTPGTPGTPDTVIPGTPGTPDTVIPGPDGTSTTIPGTPATPPTVIPGTPGTPGIPGTAGRACPAPPLVISSMPGGMISASGVAGAQLAASPSTKKTRSQDRKEGQ